MKTIHNTKSGFLRSALFGFVALIAFACGDAKNSPEQAFDVARSALKDHKWDLLYDIFPLEEQKVWDERIEGILLDNKAERQQAEQLRKAGLNIGKPADLLKKMGLDEAQWKALSQRDKFAKMFALDAKVNLSEVGIDPDILATAQVKSKQISGDRAELILDDGKGHRPKLTFKLQGQYWRFSLGDEK